MRSGDDPANSSSGKDDCRSNDYEHDQILEGRVYAWRWFENGKENLYPLFQNEEIPFKLVDWNEAHMKPTLGQDPYSNAQPRALPGDRAGWHAFHHYRQALAYDSSQLKVAKEYTLAHVELGGVIVEHEFGFRAEKMRVVALYSYKGKKDRRLLAESLGWPFDILSIPVFREPKTDVETTLNPLNFDTKDL